MSSTKRLMALAVLPVFLVTGCGGGSSTKSSSSSSSSSTSTLAKAATGGNLSDVKVDTKTPTKPTVTIPANKLPFGTSTVSPKILKAGTGKTIGAKDLVHADLVMVDGTNGKTLGSSFGSTASSFYLGDPSVMPGLVKTLVGQKVGTHLVVSIPPSQGLGTAGNTQAGLGANDSLVLYLEITATDTPLTQAQGKAQATPAGMPSVSVPSGQGALAKITVPKGAKAPSKLETATLIEGSGATVKSGQTIVATYTGQIWSSGKVFDASAKHSPAGTPSEFVIGKGQVISGWDKALVGKKVGSRVLIVVPPSEGYGTSGSQDGSIKGTDTIVFVVDILAAN